MDKQRFLTVSALTKYIKRKFDYDPHLQDVFVKGEISNFKLHTSNHIYFTLKDEKTRILAVMFSSFNRNIKFIPENGMKILIRGEITVYEPTGQYQIYVKEMQPDGIGGFYLAYEQLKEKLAQKGYFSEEHKKALPKYPRIVGVVTSPTGAAIRDILTTIKRRYPLCHVLIFPALVQGEQAAASIVKAIQQANECENDVDVLIIGRGGGSIEELWAFNEEIVAEAIYHSSVPIISAVGHETDFTIADFVSDLRAPTPTAAAELAVPHVDELLERLLSKQSRLLRVMKELVNYQSQKLARLEKSYAFRYPHRLYEQKLEQLDKVTELLSRNSRKYISLQKEELFTLKKRLERTTPSLILNEAKEKQLKTEKLLRRSMENVLKNKRSMFIHQVSKLEALSPLKIMERGYSLAYDKDGHLLKSSEGVKENDAISLKLAEGTLYCKVTGKGE